MRYYCTILAITLSACASADRIATEHPSPEDAGTNRTSVNLSETPSSTGTPLPIDSSITIGQLPNGMSYLIKQNAEPQDRAELRLVVDVGSILEDEDQLGLAHFVEHMAFNGTLHFEKQELVSYLESVGMRFGADLNAYTTFDETVYMLQIPTDSVDILDSGLQILRDWAGDVSFDADEIEKERGVVIEEWRSRRGGDARIQDRQIPIILNHSRYADRLPIGTVSNLQSFDPAALRRFYENWYRPDLMSVIAVGDFDPEQIESRIQVLFSTLIRPESGRERVEYRVEPNEETLFSIESDPEASAALVVLMYGHDPAQQGTAEEYRDGLVASLFSSMLNQRLQELTQSPTPPFVFAGTQDGAIVRTRDAYNLIALVRDGAYLTALKTLLSEARRVTRFGFTSTELDRAKADLLRGMKIAYNERDKTRSSNLANELVRHVLTDESVPGIAAEYAMTKSMLPEIMLSEVNAEMTRKMTRTSRIIRVSGPEKDDQPLPTETEIQSIFDSVQTESLEAYEDVVGDAPLLSDIPTPGRVVARSTNEKIGVSRLILSNGIRVVLKPTDFKNDQVLLGATSPGGTSIISDSLFLSASFASQLIGASGVGAYGPIELSKKLSGKAVSVHPSISSLGEGFSGSASPQDLETLFQLIYLYGTEPRADSVTFLSYQSRIKSVLSTRETSPSAAFSDTLTATLTRHAFRSRPLTVESLENLSLDDSFSFFKDRFDDFSDFTFYFVGAFNEADIESLIATYLASLPSTGRKETWRDTGIRPPVGVESRTVYKGIEPKSQVSIVFTGPVSWSVPQRRKLRLLQSVVDMQLREILREDLGGTYGVSVRAHLQSEPTEAFQFSISFGCAPERVEELTSSVMDEIRSLQKTPPDGSYLEKAREKVIRSFETGIRTNGYWLQSLMFYDDHDLDASLISVPPREFLNDITPDDLVMAAQMFMNLNRYVDVRLYPVAHDDN